MIFKKATIWECIVGAETLEGFKQNILPSFKFKKEVPENVSKSFEIVEKLLLYSYYEYDFLDPALTKALTAFEMALQFRYQELFKKKWKGTFQELLYFFNDQGYFETSSSELLDALRKTRNKQSHPQTFSGGYFIILNVFTHCVNLINDVYEDIELRKQRIEERIFLNNRLIEFLKNGGVYKDDKSSSPIYEAKIYFINNVLPIKKYYCCCKKIFKIEHEGDEIIFTNSLIFFDFISCDFSENKLDISSYNDNSLIYVTTIPEKQQEFYDNWLSNYKIDKHYLMNNTLMENKIGDKWDSARKELHHYYCQ